MNEALSSALKLWGVAESRVHMEVFGAGRGSRPAWSMVSTSRRIS